jgi:nucleotide-binding universal stress UspA family protein
MLQDNSRILVPFDSTELSIKALNRASEVALNTNSELILLYVVDITCLCPGGIREYITNVGEFERARKHYIDALEKGAEQMIKKKLKELNRRGIAARSLVRVGDPADEIADVARNEMVHEIIMGSSGSLKKLHERKGVGSISRWISEIANCHVILMR